MINSTSTGFFNTTLPIDGVFTLLKNPRDLNRGEFNNLLVHLNLLTEKSIFDRCFKQDGLDLADIAIELGFVPSRGEFKKMQGGIKISEFFKTAIIGLRFAVVSKGKRDCDVVFECDFISRINVIE